ncbi:hypothetical protein IAT40_000310 [Kwoniella sp. CBS 6097]
MSVHSKCDMPTCEKPATASPPLATGARKPARHPSNLKCQRLQRCEDHRHVYISSPSANPTSHHADPVLSRGALTLSSQENSAGLNEMNVVGLRVELEKAEENGAVHVPTMDEQQEEGRAEADAQTGAVVPKIEVTDENAQGAKVVKLVPEVTQAGQL